MKKTTRKRTKRPDPDRDTMRPEYDFSRAKRGVTAGRYAQGTNIVHLDPDLRRRFPSSAAVNEALRTFVRLVKTRRTGPARPRKKSD